jgi:hypothetical protein
MVLANDDPDRCDAGSTPARGLTMSKTDDNSDDKSERIDQLEAVVREQQRELEALAETLGIENPREEAKKYSRRAALGLGAAGVAGAAGYATGTAQAQSQPAGTIGDGDEAVDVQSVETDDALLDALDNWTEPAESAPLSISATTKGHAINFQNIEDKPTDSANSQLQYATQYFYTAGTENGGTPEQLALFGSDANDEELSIYTKADAVGSGNSQTHKRMDIEAGTPETEVRITSLNSETRLRVEGQNDNRSYLDWMNGGEFEFSLFYDPSVGTEGAMEFFDLEGGNGKVLTYEKDNRLWDFNDASVSGLREISSPTAGDLASQEWAWDSTNSRWLYKDSGGTVHYFTPDGTL